MGVLGFSPTFTSYFRLLGVLKAKSRKKKKSIMMLFKLIVKLMNLEFQSQSPHFCFFNFIIYYFEGPLKVMLSTPRHYSFNEITRVKLFPGL